MRGRTLLDVERIIHELIVDANIEAFYTKPEHQDCPYQMRCPCRNCGSKIRPIDRYPWWRGIGDIKPISEIPEPPWDFEKIDLSHLDVVEGAVR